MFSIYLAIWGEDYIREFMEKILPLHFSPGNLYAFEKQSCSVEFIFYTLSENCELFSQYPSYKILEQLMPVSIKGVETRHTNKFYLLTELHNLAIVDAGKKNSTMLFFFADVVFSEGYFARLIALRYEGYRAVVAFALLANKDEFLQSYDIKKGKEFTDYALSCLHDEIKTHFWNEALISDAPSSLMFPLEGESGILVRSFHWTPILIAPVEKNIQSYWTIDVDFVRRACLDYDKVFLVTDSKTMAAVSLSPRSELRQQQTAINGSVIQLFSQWSLIGADSFHLKFLKEKLWFFSKEPRGLVTQVENESDRIVNEILTLRKQLPNIFHEIIARAKGKKIIVFGSGGYGQLVARTLIHYDVHTSAFFDNNCEKWGIKYGPVEVIKPNYSQKDDIFIVVAAEKYEEIILELNQHKLEKNKAFIVFNDSCINYNKG